MKELTRIVTVEITTIADIENEEEIFPADIAKEVIKGRLLDKIGCDDLVVTKIQDFIMDKEGQKDGQKTEPDRR